jgi:hypothetical protein
MKEYASFALRLPSGDRRLPHVIKVCLCNMEKRPLNVIRINYRQIRINQTFSWYWTKSHIMGYKGGGTLWKRGV